MLQKALPPLPDLLSLLEVLLSLLLPHKDRLPPQTPPHALPPELNSQLQALLPELLQSYQGTLRRADRAMLGVLLSLERVLSGGGVAGGQLGGEVSHARLGGELASMGWVLSVVLMT